MNRKTAFVLTVVIFAAIAFCFLRPMDVGGFVTYGEFGNIKSVYIEGDVDIPIKVSGETDLLTVTRLGFDERGFQVVCLQAARDHKFTMGTRSADFRTDAWDGESFEIATLERYSGGEWVHERDYSNFTFTYFAIHQDISPTCVTSLGGEFTMYFPYTEPGRYRITFNFREYFGDERIRYGKSGDEVHHTTIEYTVPKASDSRYDIVRTQASNNGVRLTIRANEGSAPFRRYDKVDIEKLCDSEWIAQDIASKDAIPNYYQRDSGSDTSCALYYMYTTDLLDPNSNYRITMYFTERDGGTDYMPLQIHIRTLDD